MLKCDAFIAYTSRSLLVPNIRGKLFRASIRNFRALGGLHPNSIEAESSQEQFQQKPNPKVTTYKTRDSVERALSTDKYKSLTKSGWAVHEVPDSDLTSQDSIVTLQKNYFDQFQTWDQIMMWLRDDVSPIATELNHHPDITIKNFNNLQLTLFTHSFKALTPRDFRLALRLSEVEPKSTTQ